MRIELVWISPQGAVAKEYQLEGPLRVEDLLEMAARDPRFAEAGLASATVGVFGRIVSREEALADGDRVEICRGPAVDPKLARRARAAHAGKSRR